MTTQIEHWALLHEGDDLRHAHTIVRRRPMPDGPVSEILRADGTWQPTGAVALAALNMLEKELRPISTATARDLEVRLLGSDRTSPKPV
jgi:hypothetical protein